MKPGCRAMTKNMLYAVTGRERHYIFLKVLLEKPLTCGWSQSIKITHHNFLIYSNSTILSLGIRNSTITLSEEQRTSTTT